MNFLFVLTYGVKSILNLFLAYWLFASFGERKYGKFPTAVSFVLLAAAQTCPPLLFDSYAVRGVLFFVLTVLLAYLFRMRHLHRVLYALLFAGVSGISELAVELLLVWLIRPGTGVIKTGILLVVGMLLAEFLTFFVILLVKIVRHKPLLHGVRKNSLRFFAFPVATFASLLLQFWIFSRYPIQNAPLYLAVLLCYTLLLLSNIPIFGLIDTLYKNAINEGKLNAANEIISKQINQYIALIEHQSDIAKMRHDHKNFCIGIMSELKNGKIENVLSKIESECAVSCRNTEMPNDIIRMVVAVKSESCAASGIRINFEYRKPEELFIPAIDLAVILGNALDNAIEATLQVSERERRTIDLLVAFKHRTIMISIQNPVRQKVDVNALKTTKEDGASHGFGIISMKQLAAKYGGEVVFSCTDSVFHTTIFMQNAFSLQE